jgi:hypothetical protein
VGVTVYPAGDTDEVDISGGVPVEDHLEQPERGKGRSTQGSAVKPTVIMTGTPIPYAAYRSRFSTTSG